MRYAGYAALLFLLTLAACSNNPRACYEPQEMQYGQIMKAVPCPEDQTD